MSEQSPRLRRKGPIARVGELLVDGHADCLEELGALVIADSRINQLFARLKRGTADVHPVKNARRLLEVYLEVHETLGADFERASAEFLSAEWPKFRPDVWEENQARLQQAVTAFTERLTTLLAEYVP